MPSHRFSVSYLERSIFVEYLKAILHTDAAKGCVGNRRIVTFRRRRELEREKHESVQGKQEKMDKYKEDDFTPDLFADVGYCFQHTGYFDVNNAGS